MTESSGIVKKDNLSICLVDSGFLGENGIGSFGQSYWSSSVNHAITYLTAALRADGIFVALLDVRRNENFAQIEKFVKNSSFPFWGFSMRTIDFPIASTIAKMVRKYHPRAVIFAGGIHTVINPKDFEGNNDFDYVVEGEAEITLPKLIRQLDEGNSKPTRIIKGEKPVLDDLQLEDFDIYDFNNTATFSLYNGMLKPPMVPIITSRGCPFKCKFCQPAEIMHYGHKLRQNSVDRVIDELKLWREKYNFKSMMFYDDCFLNRRKWINEFCEKFQKEGFTQEFLIQSRADQICRFKDELKLLKESGMKGVVIGFESGNKRILEFLGKGCTVEENYEAGEILKQLGVKVIGNFMLGLPTETNEEMNDTVKLAKTVKPTIPSVSFYSPMPGSYIYDYCVSNELILVKNHEDLGRDPRKAKIVGVDYPHAKQCMDQIVGLHFGNPVMKWVAGTLYSRLGRTWLRDQLVKTYNLYVQNILKR